MKKINLLSLLPVLLLLISCSSIPKSEQYRPEPTKLQTQNPRKIIFIHGMFVTPKCWTDWLTYFKKAGYEVSAPAWPLHENSVEVMRSAEFQKKLGELKFKEVLDHYREILAKEKVKPILIGHSMGGLIAQILLSEGLAQTAIAIDSAPPQGIIVLNWSFIKSNWGAISPFATTLEPINMSFDQFSYAIANQQTLEDQSHAYAEQYVPESRQVGKGPKSDDAAIDEKKSRGPLLLIAGENDHIIPPNLNYKNFRKYESSPSFTEFQLLNGRDHWLIADKNWKEVAKTSLHWIELQFKK